MLFVLLLVHLFSRTAGASHGLLALDPRAPIDACDWNTQNCRSTFVIVRGCLTTIFACTWVSVHPNVPPPDPNPPDSFWPNLKGRIIVATRSLRRRLKLMLVAVIAPELMVGFAARQYMAAWEFSKGASQFSISRTHGHCVSMGGFVTGTGGHPIVTKKQVHEHISEIAKVRENTIKDKSKGDALSKGVALLQELWFVSQYLARVAQHLPVTELEVVTLAFAVVNVFIWVLWWGKPLDVQDPITIGSGDGVSKVQPQVLDQCARFAGLFGAPYKDYDPLLSNSVPSFWSISDSDDINGKYTNCPFVVELLIGTILGAIHCAAWNASFPSSDEKWMWRFCAVLVTVIPQLVLALGGMCSITDS
ncbi:hypothetical protein GGX14DRAFT_521400, partial [Mycena pura]